MEFDFYTTVSRKNTGSLKWDRYGNDLIPLWVADMDFRSPPPVIEALHARAEHGVFGYTIPYEDVQQTVVDYLHERHGWHVDPAWLIWLPGLVPALNVTCRAFGEPGDAVMTATPVYPPFLSAPANARRELLTSHLVWQDDHWTFDFEAMEKMVTERTRLFILCNPHNPVGRVFSREELTRLAEFCIRHDLILCSDEIHCDLILDESVRHIPTATLPGGIAERTVTLMAPSKTYNVPGLACSFAVISDPTVRNHFKKAAQGFITEVNCFGYAGCRAAYAEGEPWRQELLQVLRENRRRVYAFIDEHMPRIRMKPMQATYLAWLDVSDLALQDPAEHFQQYGVALSDGRFFGDSRYLRLNFGCPRTQLDEGLSRMKAAYDALDHGV